MALTAAIATPGAPAPGTSPTLPRDEAARLAPTVPAGPGAAAAADARSELAALGQIRLLADPPLTEIPQPEQPLAIIDARASLPAQTPPHAAPRSAGAGLTRTAAPAEAAPLLAAGAIALLTVAVNFVVDWMLHRSSGLKE